MKDLNAYSELKPVNKQMVRDRKDEFKEKYRSILVCWIPIFPMKGVNNRDRQN